MITDMLEPVDGFARTMARAKFNQSDRLKIAKPTWIKDMTAAHLIGKIEALETVLKSHAKRPYSDMDEMIGDIQILLADSWGHMHRINPTYTRPVSVERILSDLQTLRDAHTLKVAQ